MFSGIIEGLGTVKSIENQGSNIRMGLACTFLDDLKIDQSIAHNGVCLTVCDLKKEVYFVDIIEESLNRSNLGRLSIGEKVNLERSITLNDLLDGHLVQGHVDQTATVKSIDNKNGSWVYEFKYNGSPLHAIIDKGSISINGVSLTVSKVHSHGFEVSIIPYTYEHTNFNMLKIGSEVNIEFDVVGKYVERLMQLKK